MLLLAVACGLIAANIYYVQPLIGPISASLGLPSQAAGLIATMPQVGYGIGLLLVVPLGDIFENRRLSIAILCIATLALIVAATAMRASTCGPGQRQAGNGPGDTRGRRLFPAERAGATGSVIGAWSYAHGGWALLSWTGLALPLLALVGYCTERQPVPASTGKA